MSQRTSSRGHPQAAALLEIAGWAIGRARTVADDPSGFYAEICERIAAAGVPLARSTLHVRFYHPEFRAITLRWADAGPSDVVPRYHPYEIEFEPGFINSPVYWIYGGAERFRRHLENPEVVLDFDVLSDLKSDGFTDYVAERLPFIDGSNHAITWATRRPGGFSAADMDFLSALAPHLGVIFEVRADRRIAEALLRAYLGGDAATRVLKGEVRRGSGQTIEAAILFADVRNFTEMSEALPGDQVIGFLNDYFESVIAPVEDHGGEVLKLIGDGLLAIFPLHRGGPRPACLAALAAARAAFANLAELNRRRVAAGASPMRIGISLHIGKLIYGNIGGASRLDFTVIGPAVNLVGRLQSLCRKFGKGMLLTAAFAKEAGIPAVSLGHHALRGVAEPQEVFALPPSEDPYYEPRTQSGEVWSVRR